MSIVDLIPVLGILCVAYTSAEVARLAIRKSPPRTAFAAVDVKSGRAIDVTVDRRVRRAAGAPGRRSTGRAAPGLSRFEHIPFASTGRGPLDTCA